MKGESSIPAKRKRAANPSAVDAFARPAPVPVSSKPFGKLRGLLAELDAWNGSLATIPDGAFCLSLNREIFREAAKGRSRKMPTVREAIAWFTREHKSVELEVILEQTGRKLMRAFGSAPLISQLVKRVREGDSRSMDLLRLLDRLDPNAKLEPFRQMLAPRAKESLLAAAWRARAEYAEWLLSFQGRHVWLAGPTCHAVFLSVHDSWLWLLLRHDGLFGESSIIPRGADHQRKLARERVRRLRARQTET